MMQRSAVNRNAADRTRLSLRRARTEPSSFTLAALLVQSELGALSVPARECEGSLTRSACVSHSTIALSALFWQHREKEEKAPSQASRASSWNEGYPTPARYLWVLGPGPARLSSAALGWELLGLAALPWPAFWPVVEGTGRGPARSTRHTADVDAGDMNMNMNIRDQMSVSLGPSWQRCWGPPDAGDLDAGSLCARRLAARCSTLRTGGQVTVMKVPGPLAPGTSSCWALHPSGALSMPCRCPVDALPWPCPGVRRREFCSASRGFAVLY